MQFERETGYCLLLAFQALAQISKGFFILISPLFISTFTTYPDGGGKNCNAMRKNSTQINEVARLALDITRDEYALCSYVQYRQADRRVRAGWCADPKHELADFVGITRPGLYKMIDRLCGKDLLHIDAATGHLQVTGKWIDTENDKKSVNKVYTEKKQSLHGSVNKVYTDCKLSLQHGVNLVTPNIEVEYDNKEDKYEVSVKHTRAEIEKLIDLNTEQEKSPSPGSAAPLPKSAFDTWVDVLTGDYRIREGFTITQKIPGELFEDYVTRFSALARTQPEKYNRKHDLTGHFLNWSRIEYQQRGGAPSPSASQPNTARPAGIPKNIPTYGA